MRRLIIAVKDSFSVGSLSGGQDFIILGFSKATYFSSAMFFVAQNEVNC